MRRFTIRFVLMVVIVALIVGCGRRLPDEYFETNTSVTESDTSAEVAVASDTAETSDDAETAETADEDTSEAPEATEIAETDSDTAEEDSTDAETDSDSDAVEEVAEPETVLVEVPADPIIEQVANADPVNGETLFNAGVTCTSCHLVESEDRLVGPGLLNIPAHAETRVEGEIAERYLYNSIVLPNDYVVEGYPAAMYAGYNDDYTEQEVLDIVAYLMTLGDYPEREPVFMEVAVESVDEVAAVAGDADVVEETDTEAEETASEDVAETETEATEEAVEVEVTEDVAEAETEVTEEAVADAEADSEETAETAEATPEVIIVVVTATPSPEMATEVAEEATTDDEATDTETSDDVVETTADMTFEPSYTLDYSAVPQTINALAQYGSVTAGETIFTESCASCHTLDGTGDSDLSMVGSIEDAPSYIWATTYSEEVHGELATEYARDISAAEAAHLVAYLVAQSNVQTDE